MRSLLAGGGPKPHDGHLIRHRRGEPQTQRRSHVETEAEMGGTDRDRDNGDGFSTGTHDCPWERPPLWVGCG